MNFHPIVFLLLITVSSCSLLPDRHPDPKTETGGTAKIAFKSTDGGLSWQDISNGLPENLRADSVRGVMANEEGLFLTVGNGRYHSTPNATAPFWTKEASPVENTSADSSKTGSPANNFWGVNVKLAGGTSIWSPIFTNDQEPRIRSSFETAGGAIFIGTAKGFFRTSDSGKTWKLVHAGNLVGHLAESDGVMLAISDKQIIKSTDQGENWALATSALVDALDVKQIRGGFAAMTVVSASNSRGINTSFDGGKTWQTNDASHPDKAFIDSIRRTWNDRPQVKAVMTSIFQVGDNYICTHPDGIFRSSDKGKTWTLLLPSIEGKVFTLIVSGNAIYAIRSKGGC
jgi:photosystem II stability/assembly factor-like uncharacterized protein